MNIFEPHIPFHRLVDYAESRLLPNEKISLEIHLEACSRCHGHALELRHLIELMRADTGQNAPVAVIQRANQIFRLRAIAPVAASGRQPRILAVLQFDSLGMAPSFGMRSGKPGSRQILYQAGENEIDLRIEPSDQAWILSGQVFGEAVANDKAILQGEMLTTWTALNPWKEFVLPPVQNGMYTLLLQLTHLDVEIENLRLGD